MWSKEKHHMNRNRNHTSNMLEILVTKWIVNRHRPGSSISFIEICHLCEIVTQYWSPKQSLWMVSNEPNQQQQRQTDLRISPQKNDTQKMKFMSFVLGFLQRKICNENFN